MGDDTVVVTTSEGAVEVSPIDEDADEIAFSRVPTAPMKPLGAIDVELSDAIGAVEFLEHVARILRAKIAEASRTGEPVKIRVRVE